MPMSKVLGCIKKADEDYNLIKDNDRILVGISFGKDSMCLVEALRLYKFFSKKKYDIVAVNIDIGFEKANDEEAIKYLVDNGIEFHKDLSDPIIYEVLKLHIHNNKLPCSICSKMKKAAVCQAAHKYNCNKIAFAHHGDDAIETLVMNAIYGGRLSTFKVKTNLDKEKLTLIRPLVYLKEKDIEHTVKSSKIPVVKSTCPNDKHTEREVIKEMLKDLYKKYPEAKSNFMLMLTNEEHRELWEKEKE